MLKIFDKYAPRANVANVNYPHGHGKNESVSGANDGTPLTMEWYDDILGFSEALLADAGVSPSGLTDTALVSDRMTAFRIAAMRVETAVSYTGGDTSLVGLVRAGTVVDSLEYVVHGSSLTRWKVGTVAGTFAGDFNPLTGVDSGLTGALVAADTLASYVGSGTIATGSAVFNNVDNSITLVGVGVGVEIGDVIQISGAPSNSKEFTLEEIVSTGKIIVNKAHAGGTTSKALVSETATVTVKLLCKWYLAPIGLGRASVDLTAIRAFNSVHQNNTGREIEVRVTGQSPSVPANVRVKINGVISLYGGGTINVGNDIASVSFTVCAGETYQLEGVGGAVSTLNWTELR